MSNVQIRNVPEDLHRRLRARAAMEGTTVSDLLLRELERFMSRPTKDEVLARLASRQPVSTTESSAEAVRAGRQDR
ncbi:FitA-like ribbon-helix-helix domain-containing protein [Ornithinimicrobium sediminis]|uniref:FitA-like ribbon-helix-helix domain-containing protein n=1 Tax=Ornithinimicrobium sediminis TaxID=2904603 RepID=UPI001E5558EE|nr:antitoxin [Ornithinimicrobium sediminis]MCE0488286.1 antitoxin [Ornithinimicrobium sediminis]